MKHWQAVHAQFMGAFAAGRQLDPHAAGALFVREARRTGLASGSPDFKRFYGLAFHSYRDVSREGAAEVRPRSA